VATRIRTVDGRSRERLSPEELEELVGLVRAGDPGAWERLVRGLAGAVYRGLGAFNLPADARAEVFHETFVRLVEHIDTIHTPRALPSWLITTARNEARQYVRRRSRLVPVESMPDGVDASSLDEGLLDDELHVAVLRAFNRLPERCRQLLRLLTIDPPPSYAEVARLLELTHGDIGPTRGRCLDKLRRMPELVAFLDLITERRP
jgi:RNA polymerase sigma factor (sigma-70 family)